MELLKKGVIRQLNKLPYIKTLRKLLDSYEKQTAYPPGHYYSPVPDIDEITQHQHQIFDNSKALGVEFIEEKQQECLLAIKEYFKDFDYNSRRSREKRYFIPEHFFTYTDALTLFSMVRHLRPNRIVEIGSGYSSALMLDVNEIYFQNAIQLTFIDPDNKRISKLLKEGDWDTISYLKSRVQDVDLDVFSQLQANDVLFIDSSHVSKVGSDLNYLLFKVLPILQKGVIIHFHDIYYLLEYPKELVVNEKLAWNEIYLLRAFLMYNKSFEIYFYTGYMFKQFNECIDKQMNASLLDERTSLYIRKTGE